MPRSNNIYALAVILAALAAGGCSELYTANSDSIGRTAGDARAINRVTMMVDPWPVASGERNIGFSGVKMQTAMERYRNNQVYPPQGMGTSGSYQAPQNNSSQNNT